MYQGRQAYLRPRSGIRIHLWMPMPSDRWTPSTSTSTPPRRSESVGERCPVALLVFLSMELPPHPNHSHLPVRQGSPRVLQSQPGRKTQRRTILHGSDRSFARSPGRVKNSQKHWSDMDRHCMYIPSIFIHSSFLIHTVSCHIQSCTTIQMDIQYKDVGLRQGV